MEDTPESMQFKLTVEKIQGRANENVECKTKNIMTRGGLIEIKLFIWPKSVNGFKAIEMKMIE